MPSAYTWTCQQGISTALHICVPREATSRGCVFAMHASTTTASYLRVASIGIGAYEWVILSNDHPHSVTFGWYSYLLTIPAEWRFYRAQHRLGRLRYVPVSTFCFYGSTCLNLSCSINSQSCFLFVLIRWVMRYSIRRLLDTPQLFKHCPNCGQ